MFYIHFLGFLRVISDGYLLLSANFDVPVYKLEFSQLLTINSRVGY